MYFWSKSFKIKIFQIPVYHIANCCVTCWIYSSHKKDDFAKLCISPIFFNCEQSLVSIFDFKIQICVTEDCTLSYVWLVANSWWCIFLDEVLQKIHKNEDEASPSYKPIIVRFLTKFGAKTFSIKMPSLVIDFLCAVKCLIWNR